VTVAQRSVNHRLARRSSRPSRPFTVALVVDAVFPYHLGGREVRYFELTQRLADRASIHVYTMNWWCGPRDREERGVWYHALSRLYPMYNQGHRSIKQAIIFAFGCLRLVGTRFDVLEADHIPYLHILILRGVASLKRKRFVVTWHEVWGKRYWQEYLGAKGSAAWVIEWLAMHMPDEIIAASPETGDRLRAIVGQSTKIVVAPNGVDLHLARQTDPAASGTDLVVVGRLIDHKRVGMLLEAMALLHSQGVRVTCRVIGDGPERTALIRKAKELALEEAVEFCHNVREQSELYSLVKAAKVAVFPSEREGFGAAVLEALACGVSVVTTSSPDNLGQHLAIRSCRGQVCDPSAEAIATTLIPLLGSADRRSAQVDDWLAEYSWEAVAEQVAAALGVAEPR